MKTRDRVQVPATLEECVEPARTALVIWDMQVGIASRAHNLSTLVPAVRALLDSARAAGTMVIWSRHVAPRPEDTTVAGLWTLMRRQGVDDPSRLRPYMQAGTPDVEFVPELVPLATELVVEKSTPSFFIGTPIDIRLRASEVSTLVLAGVSTEQGIEFTARHALALGFLTVVVEDAVGSFSKEGHELGLAYLRTATMLARSSELAAAWSRSSR